MAVYLDNSATTRVCPAAAEAALKAMKECYGNPSSLHRMGLDAENLVRDSRKAIASAVGCPADRLFFTSCATESNNIALFGGLRANQRLGRKVITTAVEHASVLEPLHVLEQQGYEVHKLRPQNGRYTANQFLELVDDQTAMVSVMLVNNEVGIRLPVEEIFSGVRRKNPKTLLHVDAVQGAVKVPFRFSQADPDFLSLSGHKLYAPKGVGALYVKKGTKVAPLTFGGGQEQGISPGTESVPLIAAFAAAVDDYLPKAKKQYERYTALMERFLSQLAGREDIAVLSPADAVPYIASIAVKGIRSEIMLHFLEREGIFVSSGSACAKGEESHVLSAMGIPKKLADSALRISFSPETTERDLDELIEKLKEGSQKLLRVR